MPQHATAAQLAANAAFAARLRQLLAEKGMTSANLNRAMERPANYSPTVMWLAGRSRPSLRMRGLLAKALGISVATLLETPALPPGNALVPSPRPERPVDVLAFHVQQDGMCRLRLDVSLPLEQGSAVLRMLLDAGLVLRAA